MRLFIAITIDESLKKELVYLQAQLRETGADIRLASAENIHLTLRFLGEVKEETVPLIINLIKKVTSTYNPFEVELKNAGAFPSESNPRVVWVGCNEIPARLDIPVRTNARPDGRSGGSVTGVLFMIYKEVESGLLSLGFSPDDHSFSPHITLARIKSPKNKDKLAGLLKKNADFCAGKQTVREITLFQSQLHPTGPAYSIVDSGVLPDKN